MIRVAISGAGGKLATPIAEAIAASDDLELTALFNPNRSGTEMHGLTVTAAPTEVDTDVVVETAASRCGLRQFEDVAREGSRCCGRDIRLHSRALGAAARHLGN